MSLTQFSMVEELASLVKDNLPCKHLILSIEEMLIDFLQDDTSVGEMLELKPMNSYERLLVHRLADIFGFSHHSAGEGEARHLILERCPETSIPPILVNDLLWQFGEVPSPMVFDVPRPKKVMPGQSDAVASESSSLEERETNYYAARDRIFSADMRIDLVKPRPRNDTVVARRMIAHALGKTDKEIAQEHSSGDTKKHGQTEKDRKIQVDKWDLCCLSNDQELNSSSAKLPGSCRSSDAHKFDRSESSSTIKVSQQKINSAQHEEGSTAEQKDNNIHENPTRNEEHMGAAKRLFANALGIQKRDTNRLKHSIAKKTYG